MRSIFPWYEIMTDNSFLDFATIQHSIGLSNVFPLNGSLVAVLLLPKMKVQSLTHQRFHVLTLCSDAHEKLIRAGFLRQVRTDETLFHVSRPDLISDSSEVSCRYLPYATIRPSRAGQD